MSAFQEASLCNVRIGVLNEVLDFINELKGGDNLMPPKEEEKKEKKGKIYGDPLVILE